MLGFFTLPFANVFKTRKLPVRQDFGVDIFVGSPGSSSIAVDYHRFSLTREYTCISMHFHQRTKKKYKINKYYIAVSKCLAFIFVRIVKMGYRHKGLHAAGLKQSGTHIRIYAYIRHTHSHRGFGVSQWVEVIRYDMAVPFPHP